MAQHVGMQGRCHARLQATLVHAGLRLRIDAAVAGEAADHNRFEVVGTRPHTTDTTTLKLPTTVLDTPRSVTVFDASRLREQDIQTGGDLLFWVPGLNTNGAVQESYHFYARGYRMAPNDWRVDGFAGRVTGGSSGSDDGSPTSR